jgi:murein L,D-transpeptidase YcbB/YkuD
VAFSAGVLLPLVLILMFASVETRRRARLVTPVWAAQARGLDAALARYRALSADPARAGMPTLSTVVRPGTSHPGIAGLRYRLAALGDLPSASSEPEDPTRFDGDVVDAGRRVQRRHGLVDDGIFGPATNAAMQRPLADRVRQIERALDEVRRAAPQAGRSIVVNIPMFQLWAWDGPPWEGPPAVASRVIVGRARTPTPIFDATLETVTFQPAWNVPLSIARGEIIPKIERDATYAQTIGLQIVDTTGARVAVTAESLAAVRAGVLRLRQPPGSRNPLGPVRFELASTYSVNLHGTSAPTLFREASRALSHGCVRVESVEALALWLLDGQEGWTPDAVRAAIAGPRTRRIRLSRPAEVRLSYLTALVWPDGSVHFAPDIYGQEGSAGDDGPADRAPCLSEDG